MGAVQVGVPPEFPQVDVEELSKVFPYGKLLPIEGRVRVGLRVRLRVRVELRLVGVRGFRMVCCCRSGVKHMAAAAAVAEFSAAPPQPLPQPPPLEPYPPPLHRHPAVVVGGLSFGCGRVVPELGDVDDTAIVAVASVSLGYHDKNDEAQQPKAWDTRDGH